MLAGTEAHPHAAAVLGGALAPSGHPNHAYLFHGPAGTGKRAVAQAFAAALLSEGAANPDEVAVRVEHRSHPDLMWVSPTGAHELRVDDVKPVVAAASHTPFEASRRVFVIESVDAMHDAAANRMLKTLEEPPAFVHLILLTDRPTEVMETIASRCQGVRFDPLPPEEIADRLREDGVAPDTATACARLALGDGDRARALAGEEGRAVRAAAERFARAATAGEMAAKPWREVLGAAKARGDEAVAALVEQHESDAELIAKRDRRRFETEHTERSKRAQRRAFTRTLDLSLGLVALWYRDAACVAWDAPDLACHADRMAELTRDAEDADPQKLRQAVELVEETRRRLALNVSEELACEALGYRLERLLG